jgi:hypothetical protein
MSTVPIFVSARVSTALIRQSTHPMTRSADARKMFAGKILTDARMRPGRLEKVLVIKGVWVRKRITEF